MTVLPLQITSNIHGEVDSQHKILDRMAQSISGIQLGLGASVDKFKKVGAICLLHVL
jgi:hypothetical protein